MRTARARRRLAIALSPLLIAAVLSGCGGGGGGSSNPTPPTPPAAKLEDNFGTGFAAAFQAAPTAEPTDPAADILTTNATADPVPVD